jgi:hypothetical protein
MKDKSKRQKWIHLRVTEEEYSKLQNVYQGTTCRMFSDFLRTVLLRRPITVYYRNRTADEFVTVALQLKNEMNDIGRNFNQVVRKINIAHSDDELGLYLFDLHIQQDEARYKIKEICLKMEQIYKLLAAERDHLGGNKKELEELTFFHTAAADRRENEAGR